MANLTDYTSTSDEGGFTLIENSIYDAMTARISELEAVLRASLPYAIRAAGRDSLAGRVMREQLKALRGEEQL